MRNWQDSDRGKPTEGQYNQPVRPSNLTIALILTAGVLAISFGSVLVRLATTAAGFESPGLSLVISALRLTAASLLLLPAWQALRGARLEAGAWIYAVLAGVLLAVHFATWITSISFTSIAVSTTLVNTNPLWVALLAWLWLGQRPSALTLAGIAVAFAGGVVIALGGSSNPGSNPALGNLLALLGALAASCYFLLGREAQRRGFGIGLYAAVAYSTAAVVLLLLPPLFQTPFSGYPPAFYLWVVLMALIPQLIGHTSFNWAVKWINPVIVTLVILLEPIGASLLAFALFGELPGAQVLAGAGVMLAGVVLAVLGNRS
ncbi:carboxylate/amino acid/amine transporter [Calidithermus roseus]|uniref:Carboxylate/amino acid/amine transporter n=1 Tax=Calidithermus roseus TaxID=1644118 RepID=A0A399ENP8_9DEIN|nr:carboxylate/amino acid/amine transporter [Calidithermus roseus]